MTFDGITVCGYNYTVPECFANILVQMAYWKSQVIILKWIVWAAKMRVFVVKCWNKMFLQDIENKKSYESIWLNL